ncbi:diguanylate cyclase [Crenobacter sp. SG2305]|uniref:sensor domain-containing diguanylate cyclase n=1 Tax=Crenobacter oryzisoli TaxID=3056844 RepID=UPI0025AA8C34|nr:diguanylate cyclase [Crenobacter sp. SG2305]MDN0081257.1 diguanylate cyclase [Crenobacter sp. SG2305]
MNVWVSRLKGFARLHLDVPVTALLYALVGVATTLLFPTQGLLPAPLWPPSALALVLFIWRSGRGLPGVWLGACWVTFQLGGMPGPAAMLVGTMAALGPWIGARLLRQLQRAPLRLSRQRDVWPFLWCGTALPSLIAAVGGTAALSLSGGDDALSLATHFLRWWLSDAGGILLFAPLALLVLEAYERPGFWGQWRFLERMILTCCTLGVAAMLFWVVHGDGGQLAVLSFLLMLPMIWTVARFPLWQSHLLSTLVALVALVGTVHGGGVFYIDSIRQALLCTGTLVMVQSVALLVVGSLVAEREESELFLRDANQHLEDKVRARTRELSESEARFKLVADAAPFPMVMNQLSDGQVVYANPRAEALFHYQLLPGAPLYVQAFYADETERDQISGILRNQGTILDREVELIDGYGRRFWAWLSCTVIKSNGVLCVLTGINDISERKRLESSLKAANDALRQQVSEIEELQHGLREQAVRDPLTGLFNRRYLDSSLSNTLSHLLAQQRSVGLIMLDVDHFKQINDNHGHLTGDMVLATLGQYLRAHFRSDDIVCRYGGEEFVVVLPGASMEVSYAKAERLRQGVAELVIPSANGMLAVTLSLGVACAPQHGTDTKRLLDAADAALYAAKSHGRNRVYRASIDRLVPGEVALRRSAQV